MRNFKIEDFIGCGQYLVRTSSEHINDTGYLSTIMQKVGYTQINGLLNTTDGICLISMSDGWIQFGYFDEMRFIRWDYLSTEKMDVAKQKLCNYLNNSNLCKDEYRFATHEEVVRVVLYQQSRTK